MSKMRRGARGFQTVKVRQIPHHDCKLPLEDNPANYRIYEGYCVQFRRKLWSWVTVSPSDLNSKKYLKSATKIHAEELRHLIQYPNTIHPFSVGRFAWEMIMLPVWLTLYFFIPVILATPYDDTDTVSYHIKLGLDVMCWIDIVLWFFTGYYDKKKQIVVLKFSKIARQYIFSYFIFDLVSSLPYKVFLATADHGNEYKFITSILLLKAARLPTVVRYIHKFSERTGLLQSNINFVCFTMLIIILVMWTTSTLYMVIKISYPAVIKAQEQPMLLTAYCVTKFLMATGTTFVVNNSELVMLIQIIFITFGVVLGVIVLAKVTVVYQKISTSRNKYNNLLEQIGEYMTYKELPIRVKGKIMNYVDYKFQKHIFREEDALSNLSSVLKHDILLQKCRRMVERVEFFKDLPHDAMLRIVTRLRSEIFLSNDVIVLAGYAGNSMYFIYTGTVAVYTATGKEICHLEDGDHFGEITLIIGNPRVATVVAVKECELFKLSRKDFQEAIEPFPELRKKIRVIALSRLETTLQILAEEASSLGRTNEDEESDDEDSGSLYLDTNVY